MGDWEFIKRRTAADGEVWRSADGVLYKRTGDQSVAAEADFQRRAAQLGYPVPQILADGFEGSAEGGRHFFTEHSLGEASLHDAALAGADAQGQVPEDVVDAAAAISGHLLAAQARSPLPGGVREVRAWIEQAGFTANVFAENPDLDTPRTHAALDRVVERLRDVPMCHSHLDYGLPNAFPTGVIDWQHHGPAPLGYDVYPMLDIVAFKGGGKGYRISPAQRARYLLALDSAALEAYGRPLSGYLPDFLLVKCLFFLALMRPADPQRRDKHLKWHYRRALFQMGLEHYEDYTTIDTAAFPTLAEFTAGAATTTR
ncbi:phosphotransferase [Streptosporangium sp. NPDC049248]|uniref:phosphotransferase n=1 Tax=Streptosporangium sp. NPDC049248 TaxID=3155651 RepID=UPI003448E343